jgi:hypothetical protein
MKTYKLYTSIDGELAEIRSKGSSAYESAVRNGFTGTEEEWLASLQGKQGISPTITENENNDDDTYKLDITDVNGTFTTPNLKGTAGSNSTTGEEINIDLTDYYTKEEIDSAVSPLVDNSHTHDNKDTLDNFSSDDSNLYYGGQTVTINGVTINDELYTTEATLSSYKISQLLDKLSNEMQELINSTTDNIDDNTVSTEKTYSSVKIENKINTIEETISGVIKRDIVSALPQDNIDNSTIYMVLKENGAENNIYDEYMYINSNWELIGNTEINLNNYYSKEEVDSLLGIILTDELAIGETELIITNENITTDSMIDIYTDTFNIRPTNVVISNGNITLTFDAQEVTVNVKVVVR